MGETGVGKSVVIMDYLKNEKVVNSYSFINHQISLLKLHLKINLIF